MTVINTIADNPDTEQHAQPALLEYIHEWR